MNLFTLDEKARPVLEPDEAVWDRWFDTANRSAARDVIGRSQISTLFTGVGLGDASTAIWQSKVIGGPLDGTVHESYGSKSAALAKHQDIVSQIIKLQSTL